MEIEARKYVITDTFGLVSVWKSNNIMLDLTDLKIRGVIKSNVN